MKKFSALSLSTDNDLNNEIEKICYEHNIHLDKATGLCDLFDAINVKKYDLLILVDKDFPLDVDLVNIFERMNYYIPHVALISNKKVTLQATNITKFRTSQLQQLNQFIEHVMLNYEMQTIKLTSDFKNKIYLQLVELGISQKYKGFSYLLEIINKLLISNGCIKSFRKIIYPYIASLFGVTEESVERDVRNVLKINYKKASFREKINFNDRKLAPTTRNIINTLLVYLKTSKSLV